MSLKFAQTTNARGKAAKVRLTSTSGGTAYQHMESLALAELALTGRPRQSPWAAEGGP